MDERDQRTEFAEGETGRGAGEPAAGGSEGAAHESSSASAETGGLEPAPGGGRDAETGAAGLAGSGDPVSIVDGTGLGDGEGVAGSGAETSGDGEEHEVDPRSVTLVRLIALPAILLGTGTPLAILSLLWLLGLLPGVVFLPLLLSIGPVGTLAAAFAWWFPAVSHRHLRYRVDPKGLRIRRGVFWRTTIWIPITRVQHTDVSQGPLQRQFELATLTVHTAGTANASIPLSGLEHGVATRLSDHLRPDRERDAR
jgi:membrane protein YdbS with pleckstrin-like domain